MALEPDVEAYDHNPCTWETEAEGLSLRTDLISKQQQQKNPKKNHPLTYKSGLGVVPGV